MSAYLPRLSLTLAAAAVLEFATLRFLLRMGPELPEGRLVDAGLNAVYYAGLWTMNVAAILAAAALGLVAFHLPVRANGRAAMTALAALAGLALIVFTWAAGRWGTLDGQALLVAQTAGIPLLAVALTLGAEHAGPRKAWLVAIGLAYVAAGVHYTLRLTSAGAVQGAALSAAEWLAVAAALAAPLVLRPGWDRVSMVIAAGASAMFLGFAIMHQHISWFIVIWDTGFGSVAPSFLQAFALGSLLYTALALARQRHELVTGAALLLIATAGVKLDYTYYCLMAFAGVALLCAAPPLQRALEATLETSHFANNKPMPESAPAAST